MSTKIYNAFRVKRSVDVWPFLWALRDKARAHVDLALRDHYWDLVRRMDPESREYQEARTKSTKDDELGFRLAHVRDKVRKAFQENVVSLHRGTYTLEVAVAVYPHKGRYYLRTFCDPLSVVGTCLDFVEQLPELEDFHYQNQTDRPEDVNAQEWKHRKTVWDEITKTEGSGNHVVLNILSWSGFIYQDPWFEIARAWHKDPPTLPSLEEIWVEDFKKLKSLRNDTITFEPGVTIQGSRFRIFKQDGSWFATIGKRKPRRFPTLARAANYVWFEFQPASIKETARRMMAGHRQKKREEHARKQAERAKST